jgi:hypothetical protein
MHGKISWKRTVSAVAKGWGRNSGLTYDAVASILHIRTTWRASQRNIGRNRAGARWYCTVGKAAQ